MPALKYWNGSAWVSFIDQGSAPSPPAAPAVRGQPGSVMWAGTAAIGDINTSAGGLYNCPPGWFGDAYYSQKVQVNVFAMLYAGYGGSDTVFTGDIFAGGPNAVAAGAPNPIFSHAAYYVAVPMVASWSVDPGLTCAFLVRCNYQSGSNIHTSGGVNWIHTVI